MFTPFIRLKCNTVYGATSAIQQRNASLPDGYNAVANFDGDSLAEVVLVANGAVWLLDDNMAVKWGPVAIPGGGYGGPPTIADFDGDGEPEIGVAGASQYAVFETNGTLKWQAVVQDSSSNRTGSSVFDFQFDGSAEVVYGDELRLWVFNGVDGSVLFQTPKSSCTWYEYPLVADVDSDGHAEILGVANNNCGFGIQRGVFLWGDDRSWVETRDVWNQHTYHITNVLQDGTIPSEEIAHHNWCDNGPSWRAVMLRSAEQVLALKPDAALLAGLDIGVVGPYAQGDVAFELRGPWSPQPAQRPACWSSA